MTDAEFVRHSLLEALSRLASDPVVQIAFLDRTGMCIDEFALDFDYAFERIEMVPVTDPVRALLREIDQKFEAMTATGPDCWTDEALAGSDWSLLRELSRQALAEFGYQWRPELVIELNLLKGDHWKGGLPSS